MFRTVTSYLLVKQLFVLCTLISSTAVLRGQNLNYEGPYKAGIYKGDASFEYNLVDGDTLLNGKFTMQRSDLDSLLEGADYAFFFDGAFEKGYPEGFWRFELGKYRSDGETRIVDGQYRVNVNGVKREAYGIIRKGRPDGQWIFMVNQIKNSALDKTRFRSVFSFEDGVPQKSFRIENDSSTLVGRFLRNGFAHDVWTLYSKMDANTSENWHFIEGRLAKIEMETDGQVETIAIYDGGSDQSKAVTLDARFIALVQLRLKRENSNGFVGGMSRLLNENTENYQQIDTILSELGKSSFVPQLKVTAPYFPLDSLETARLDSIVNWFKKSEAITRSLLNDPQLNILKRSDDEVDFKYEVVKTISEEFLMPLKQLVEYRRQGVLEFAARDELLAGLWPVGKPSATIEVEINTTGEKRTYTGPEGTDLDFDDYKGLESVHKLAQYAYLSLESIASTLKDKLANEKRQQTFIALEKQMIAQADSLGKQVDSVQDKIAKPSSEALVAIKKRAEDELANYSQIEATDAKLVFAQNLISCLTALNDLAKSITALPMRNETIQEVYSDAVWNPFTATIMNEDVKKRITAAYRDILVPDFLNRVQTAVSCDNARELHLLFENSYQRILELRNEETSKLERKLKREKNPEIIIQLFNIPSTTEEH
ncbi:hypothetical protein [Allomuricauda sp. SCSIO 65647]|uniref:hypothetical protein n=1 Tax=Allomuricauda sp. SCSIO 65647 TaxID=2908843 RepID=UPI001F286ADD|nr:hypothetical protein [Muricauda sp. SCSIO 65647]UJH67341.1 hypothetical protein L0P89_15500 [Muricauda sp. SCSIO 65647]